MAKGIAQSQSSDPESRVFNQLQSEMRKSERLEADNQRLRRELAESERREYDQALKDLEADNVPSSLSRVMLGLGGSRFLSGVLVGGLIATCIGARRLYPIVHGLELGGRCLLIVGGVRLIFWFW
ncbi:hypothetical protein BDN72DRAFT_880975 [Pluteus cervinus]|uniref:Uncharacterized protein n=1 Tax=Pluteus cervinus TaxID=181527 RepID=A0ACD3AIK0_9AGAR|nr:hypothetical protein BDN72DRAFT_880975 [Pluteus cervinus]